MDNKLSVDQHGFIHGRSCLTNLWETFEACTRLLDEGYGLDLSDTVPHHKLIMKLSSMGIIGKVLAWLEDFLSDRKMRVKVNGSFSSWLEECSGVPQGSVPGAITLPALRQWSSELGQGEYQNVCGRHRAMGTDTLCWRFQCTARGSTMTAGMVRWIFAAL